MNLQNLNFEVESTLNLTFFSLQSSHFCVRFIERTCLNPTIVLLILVMLVAIKNRCLDMLFLSITMSQLKTRFFAETVHSLQWLLWLTHTLECIEHQSECTVRDVPPMRPIRPMLATNHWNTNKYLIYWLQMRLSLDSSHSTPLCVRRMPTKNKRKIFNNFWLLFFKLNYFYICIEAMLYGN